MREGASARRAVAITSLAAAAVLFLHGILWDVVRSRPNGLIAHTPDLVTIGNGKASLFRWALVADMVGDYLLFVPAVVYLWRTHRRANAPMADLTSVAGAAFALAGALGAAVYATAGETLIRDYAHAAVGARDHIAVVFSTLSHAIVIGLWQIMGGVTGGVWLIGTGTLVRGQSKWFARYSVLLGVFVLAGAAVLMAGVDLESSAPATVGFFPIVAWIGWLGLLLWQPGQPSVADPHNPAPTPL